MHLLVGINDPQYVGHELLALLHHNNSVVTSAPKQTFNKQFGHHVENQCQTEMFTFFSTVVYLLGECFSTPYF